MLPSTALDVFHRDASEHLVIVSFLDRDVIPFSANKSCVIASRMLKVFFFFTLLYPTLHVLKCLKVGQSSRLGINYQINSCLCVQVKKNSLDELVVL